MCTSSTKAITAFEILQTISLYFVLLIRSFASLFVQFKQPLRDSYYVMKHHGFGADKLIANKFIIFKSKLSNKTIFELE